ncbi:bromodomain adjacent to zinc finger domain protein 1A-like [Anopheles stephensi]|uniref:bromodomain adjacent to zinc finger domain protein 1A-like n=1 Tax=Anopheles stephensi TaxID=30069 RepID=UPI0016589E78|nr:bromodomain adjacent to zinc finger domain protein 1A-like [Anopheles stephensi]
MPLLKRKALQKTPEPEHLKDSDEVFVCETTGELFSNYDDFFMRTMLLSSTVWSCVMTGRTNLTYVDALESEKSAKRTLKTFPVALKGPILLIASRTKRTAIHDLSSDVHGYAKDVFFKGETVYTKTGDPEVVRKAKIVRVVISDPAGEPVPSRLIYHVESEDGESPANYSVRGEAIMRERNCLSREKCKLFLKQHVELGANQMLCVKKTSLEQFVTSKGCTDDKVFYGQKPDFKVSKKLQSQDKARAGVAKPAKKSKKADQQQAKVKGKENKKQPTIEKYLQQSANDSLKVKPATKAPEKRKTNLEERAEKRELAKKRMKLEKTLLVSQVALALKEYSSVKEDLQLTDQRVMPPARAVRTLIGEQHFPDFLFILEFLNTFGDVLSIETKFPDGVSVEQLERALLLRETDGPLCDILQILLSALFEAWKNAIASEESNIELGAKRLIRWCSGQLSMNITDLPLDWTTVSELLRLHLTAHNHSTSFGDASYKLNRDHPHILRALTTHTVFQLATEDVMQIICALIHNLLTTEEILGQVEAMGEARIKIKNNRLEQRRVAHKKSSLMQTAHDSFKKELASKVGQLADKELEDYQKQMEQSLKNSLEELENEASAKMIELREEAAEFKPNQVYLGSDRAFRNYWQFQSLPGLFVEHDTKFAGRCMEQVTKHIPGLAQCDAKTRKKFITDSIFKCAGNSAGLIDIDADGKLRCEDDVYEQLLHRGSALLAQTKTNPFSLATANGTAKDEGGRLETANAVSSSAGTCPSNRELLMCTGDEISCPVHPSNHPGTASWSYYATAHELDALIGSLNPRGRREKPLRETLQLYRDLIVAQMERCPIAKLSVQENEPHSALPDTNQSNEMLETMFREYLVDLEVRITAGCLGELKVNDVEKWRNAILNRSYDAQITGQLEWGLQRLQNDKYAFIKKKNQESSSEESEEEDADLFQSSLDGPENGLPEATNANGSMQEGSLRATVRSLASALLQVAQSVDPKFFRHPFGPKGVCKDRNTIAFWQSYGQKKFLRWEVLLMQANSFSQLFLHYHILYDAIRWSRSIERAVCMVCRLKGDASVTLLCDECNRACHMYCLKPKLKQIPAGDWFCMQCRPEDHAPKHNAGTRKRAQINDYVASDDSEDDVDKKDDAEEEDDESNVSEAEMSSEDSSSSSSEEDAESMEDEEETESLKPKIVLNKKASGKKVTPTVNAKQAARKRAQNQEPQRRTLPKRSRQSDSRQEEPPSQKRRSSNSANRPSAGRRSLRLSGRN